MFALGDERRQRLCIADRMEPGPVVVVALFEPQELEPVCVCA